MYIISLAFRLKSLNCIEMTLNLVHEKGLLVSNRFEMTCEQILIYEKIVLK